MFEEEMKKKEERKKYPIKERAQLRILPNI